MTNNIVNETPNSSPKKQWIKPELEVINKDIIKSGSAAGTETPLQTTFLS